MTHSSQITNVSNQLTLTHFDIQDEQNILKIQTHKQRQASKQPNKQENKQENKSI